MIFYVLLTISCNIHMIFNRHNYKLIWRIDLANFAWILLELLVFQILKLETCQSLFYHHQHVCFFFDPCFNCSCCCWIKKKKSASFGDEWKVRAGLIWYLTIWWSFAGRYVLLLTEMHALICTITSLVYYRFCHRNNYQNYFSCHTWAAFAFFLFIYCFSQDICFQYVHCTDLQLKPFISLLEAVER